MNYMNKEDIRNCTIITEFFLMDFSNTRELQVLYAMLLLLIYVAALMGNLLIFTAIVTDPQLHYPMYFFLSNLSLLDLGYISVTLPKFIVNSLTGNQSISVLGCAAQIFFLTFFAGTEFALLVSMSYDRFVAICHPLHYGVTMTPVCCLWVAMGSWVSGLVSSVLHTVNMFRLPVSGYNMIHQFFCDIPPLLKVLSSDVRHTEYILLGATSVILLFCLGFVITSYTHIFSTVFKIPSEEGRCKALSTCLPQLIILILFILGGAVTSFSPLSSSSLVKDLLISITYTVLPPLMNPIIYSLRNMKIKVALSRIIKTTFFHPPTIPSMKKLNKE